MYCYQLQAMCSRQLLSALGDVLTPCRLGRRSPPTATFASARPPCRLSARFFLRLHFCLTHKLALKVNNTNHYERDQTVFGQLVHLAVPVLKCFALFINHEMPMRQLIDGSGLVPGIVR